MKKKHFKPLLLFTTGVILGVFLTGIFYNWALQKSILVSDQLNFSNNTSEIIMIIHDYNNGKVEHDYTSKLLERRIDTFKQTKALTYEILSRGKSNSKYENYGAALDQIINSLERVKEKVSKGDIIDTKKDMNEFISSFENYTLALQEVL